MLKKSPGKIEVDDSGSGSLYGGIIILLTDHKNDFYREVPLKLFAIKDKQERRTNIQKEIFNIIMSGAKKLHAAPSKTIFFICQGNIFDYAEKELKAMGFMVERKKIKGRTNAKAERLFKKLLKEKYNIKNYDSKDYRAENLRQYALLRTRKDFKNVKRNSRGVMEIILHGEG